jgi:hypothetical protein
LSRIVTINPPSLDFTVGESGNYAVKAWRPLEVAAMRYEAFPEDVEIVRAWISSEQMADYPVGSYGDVSWAPYSKLYGDLSGVPLKERCAPIGPHLLGSLQFKPGADNRDIRDFAFGPDRQGYPYRPGDRIGIFPQVMGMPDRSFQLYTGLTVFSPTGFVELPGIIYHDLPNMAATGNDPYSYRNTYSDIPKDGDEIRITVMTLDDPLALSHMSVGVRDGDSGFNMKADPTPVTWNAAASPTCDLQTFVRSDWVPMPARQNGQPVQKGDSLLIHSCLSGGWAYKDVAVSDGNPGCFVAGTSGHDARTFNGTVQVISGTRHRKHLVAMIEVQ